MCVCVCVCVCVQACVHVHLCIAPIQSVKNTSIMKKILVMWFSMLMYSSAMNKNLTLVGRGKMAYTYVHWLSSKRMAKVHCKHKNLTWVCLSVSFVLRKNLTNIIISFYNVSLLTFCVSSFYGGGTAVFKETELCVWPFSIPQPHYVFEGGPSVCYIFVHPTNGTTANAWVSKCACTFINVWNCT